MRTDGACFLVRIDVVEHQGLDVPIKNNSDEFALPINDRASGIASDDVSRADEIEWRGEIELRPPLLPYCGEFELVFVLMRFGVLKRAA
jgi:hypothetical protein